MDCRETELLLSHYHDDELASKQRNQIESHFEICPECIKQLDQFRELSNAARNLTAAPPPRDLWDRISANLCGQMSPSKAEDEKVAPTDSQTQAQRRLVFGNLSTSAVVLISLRLLWSFRQTWVAGTRQEPLLSNVKTFQIAPLIAQQQLTDQYSGHSIAADAATWLMGYRQRIVEPPPSGFTRVDLVLLDMSCCRCVQTVWQRRDGSHLAIFQRDTDIEDWFPNQPSVLVDCEGKRCRVTGLHGQVAASWGVGKRGITLIGLRDIAELIELVPSLS